VDEYLIEHSQVVAELRAHGIDCARPGFYDQAEFVAQERRDPSFLEWYAQFVATVPVEPNYVARVRREVPVIAAVLHENLVADGRLGACVDIGMLFSRILEEEGFWNCQINGSLKVEFPARAALRPQHFWSFDYSLQGFAAAHSWLVVPPYSIVDVAVRQQPYRVGRDLVPPFVLSESRERASPEVERVISHEVRAAVRRDFGTRLSDDEVARLIAPNWLKFRNVFPPTVVRQADVTLTYDAVAVGAPDAPFEEMDGWKMNGRLGIQLYRESVQPALRALRSARSQSLPG
jgi:hypothetical protein